MSRGVSQSDISIAVLLWTKLNESGFSCVLDEFGSGMTPELGLYVCAVRFGGADADVAQSGDVGVRVAEHEQPQHLFLLRRESERRVRGSM